jgi:hypothetical protein
LKYACKGDGEHVVSGLLDFQFDVLTRIKPVDRGHDYREPAMADGKL